MEGLQAPLVVACGSYRESDWVPPPALGEQVLQSFRADLVPLFLPEVSCVPYTAEHLSASLSF